MRPTKASKRPNLRPRVENGRGFCEQSTRMVSATFPVPLGGSLSAAYAKEAHHAQERKANRREGCIAASKTLQNPKVTKSEKTASASALAQAPLKKKSKS